MIFRRGKKAEVDQTPDELEESEAAANPDADPTDANAAGPDAPDAADAAADDTGGGSAATLDLDALDAQDWRSEGPWDVSEVELDEDEDEDEDPAPHPRIDLGSMILTGFPGAELRLQMSEESQQIVSAMLINDDSAIELGAYAAPRSGGLWSELRDEMIENATEAGGSAALVEGPFGVELRRLLPVSTPEGEQGYQPSRMWVVEGPRWLLRGIVYGQAALEDGLESPVAEMLEAFRSVIVRRGDEAMAPGDLLPLVLPQGLTPEAEPEQA
jgi:hypothetical protein